MHIKRNEAENFFFPSPKNKARLLKEKDNEKSPAQQGSTLKRNIKIILTVSKAQGFFFPKKKGTSYNLPKQTNKTKDRRQRQTCTHTKQKCSHNTHTQLSTQIKNVGMVIVVI